MCACSIMRLVCILCYGGGCVARTALLWFGLSAVVCLFLVFDFACCVG